MWRRVAPILALWLASSGCGWNWEPTRAVSDASFDAAEADTEAEADAETDADAESGADVGDASDASPDADCTGTTDLSSDPKNCGKCGVVCRDGYACLSKVCGNTVMQLAAGRLHT